MNEAKAIARCEEAAALLPPRFRRAALQMPDHRKRYTEEFRLRAGQPPAALLPEGEVTLPYFGADSRVTPRDLAQMVDAVTDYSRYACAETLRQGFLCLHGGFRLGVCGTAVLRNGAVASLRDISSLSLRIVTERIGLAEPTADSLFCAGAFRSTLLLSPPGGGKTTLLRDLIRTLSLGSENRAALRVAVVDERGEIAVCAGGEAQMALGTHTDVLTLCPKAQGIGMVQTAFRRSPAYEEFPSGPQCGKMHRLRRMRLGLPEPRLDAQQGTVFPHYPPGALRQKESAHGRRFH